MGAVPHRPEAVELVHQKVDEFLGAAVKLLDAVVQRQIFPVAFRLPLLHIHQKILDIFHGVQLVPAHPEGKVRVAPVVRIRKMERWVYSAPLPIS